MVAGDGSRIARGEVGVWWRQMAERSILQEVLKRNPRGQAGRELCMIHPESFPDLVGWLATFVSSQPRQRSTEPRM